MAKAIRVELSGLTDLVPWSPTAARVRDAILLGNFAAIDQDREPLLRELFSPTPAEVDAMGDDVTAACKAGRFIDFGMIPNQVIMQQADRSARLYGRHHIGVPFIEPWVMMHRWEGIAPSGMEHWLKDRECIAVYCIKSIEDDPFGPFEVVEMEPMVVNGVELLVFGDRCMLFQAYDADGSHPDPEFHGKGRYYARAIPGIWRLMAQMQLGGEDPYLTAAKAAAGNLLDPVMTCLAILNTHGVSRETVPAPVKLNKHRLKAGKFAIPPYDIVHTEAYVTVILRRGQPRVRGEDQGGTHASPEMHYRHGFERTLRSGRTTWVRDTLVNATDEARAAFMARRSVQTGRSHYEVRP